MSAALKPRRELSLYERAQHLAEVDARVDAFAAEHDGEISPELEAELDAALAGFSSAGEARAKLIEHHKIAAGNIAAEIERLTALGAETMAVVARKESELKAWMEHVGLTTVKSALFKKIAIEPGSPKTVIAEGVTPEDVRAAGFARLKPAIPEHWEFDKNAMLAAAREGRTLPPGVSVVQDTKLVIK